MNDNRFIELAKIFLIYSFEGIDFNYDELTDEEQTFTSEEEFKEFTNKILNDN